MCLYFYPLSRKLRNSFCLPFSNAPPTFLTTESGGVKRLITTGKNPSSRILGCAQISGQPELKAFCLMSVNSCTCHLATNIMIGLGAKESGPQPG